jgi:dTMP kinase
MSRGLPATRGVLIAIEGIDGAGKSTLQRELAARWSGRGWPVVLRREPNDPALGREAQKRGAVDPLAGALFFTLDRALAREETLAALRKGAIVLQDRSYYSTIAYQASRLGAGERLVVLLLQQHVALEPDRVLWLDLPPATAIRRLSRRGQDRAPLERRATLVPVRRAYRRLCRPPRWVRLDASRTVEELVERADQALKGYLRGRRRTRAART